METLQPTEINESTTNKEILSLINNSELPLELKSHFSDIIKIFYHGVAENNKAKQVMQILDELNLAKREYCQKNEIDQLPAANELIHLISTKLFESSK